MRAEPSGSMVSHYVAFSLGSNFHEEHNIDCAVGELCRRLTNVVCSRRMWTVCVGEGRGRYLNMMVSGRTTLSREAITAEVKRIEALCGRTEADKRRGLIAVDIDLMAYDGQRLRGEEWQRYYIRELSTQIDLQ